jgi:hypothetical protein
MAILILIATKLLIWWICAAWLIQRLPCNQCSSP